MKRLLALLLTLLMVLSLVPAALAAGEDATQAAQALYDLGLFQGTGTNADGTPNFDLDRTPTRAEAVTMLVRLLGKDAAAKAGTWTTPFTDVDEWAKPYVGYAYANGLTTGTSATTFGGASAIDATQYLTFVLRALGYTSGTDFQWDKAWERSDAIGLTHGEYHAGASAFTRGDVAMISERALGLKGKGASATMLSQLVAAGAVTKQAEQNYLHPPVKAQSVTLNKTSLELQVGKSETLTATVLPNDTADKTITWTSANSTVATVEDGKITAKQAGSTTITAATANGKTASCTVAVKNAPIIYTGFGDDVITGISVPAGIYRVVMTNSGDEHFSVVTYDNNGEYNALLANDSGKPFAGEAVFREGSTLATTGWSMEVSSESNWSIEISEVTDRATTNMKGTGAKVTGLISGDAFCAVSMTNSGSEHFSIIVYNSNGEYESLLANTSGNPYSGKKSFNLKKGNEYFLVIDSESAWTVDFGLGDSVTTYAPPKAGAGASSASGPSNSSDSSEYNEAGEKKWSSDDAVDLSEAVRNANTAALNAYKACVEALKTPALNTLSYSRAVNEAKAARAYLGDAIRLCESRASIPFDDGSTLLSAIEEVDGILDEIDDISITSTNVDAYADQIDSACQSASTKMVGVLGRVSALLDAFG